MKHLKKHFFAALLFAASLTTFAQVGIGTQNPAASLDIVGDPTNSAAMDGVIYPQLTGNQLRTKAYTPTQMGAMVYVTAADTAPAGQTINVTTTGYYAFDGTVWIPSSIRPADIPRGLDLLPLQQRVIIWFNLLTSLSNLLALLDLSPLLATLLFCCNYIPA